VTLPRGSDIDDKVRALFAQQPDRALRKAELRRLLDLPPPPDAPTFREVFRDLLDREVLVRRGRGRYGPPPGEHLVRGRLSVHHRGFGFVTPEDGGPDIFIPPAGLGLALSGDHVEVTVQEETERGIAGHVRRIVERGHEQITGEYVVQEEGTFLRPLRRDFPDLIPLRVPGPKPSGEPPAEHGDWVVAQLRHPESTQDVLHAVMLQRLSAGASVADDLDAIVIEYGLPPPYSDAEAAAAAELQPAGIARDDLRGTTVVTIDPSDAKDFDDALSVCPGESPGTITVGVHIADVAAYVQPGSPLDTCARERGFTAYLPGRTLPMLPTPLAAHACSLREGEERPAHSVFLTIVRATGEVIAAERRRTLISVDRRFDFDEVQQFLDADSGGNDDSTVATVRELGSIAQAMRARRRAEEHFLDLAAPEVRVLCEGDPPTIVGLRRQFQREAHQLVEEFMLAANVAVAQEFCARQVAGLFRVHSAPREKYMEEFRQWARRAVGLRPGHLSSRESVNTFLEGLRGQVAEEIVGNAFLRALPRAGYSAVVQEHFGLGKDCYCHFTSPIRRYPDLVVHQQLWRLDSGLGLRSQAECAETAGQCTQAEANNDQAYFAALDRLKLRYIGGLRARGEGTIHEGVIARLLPEGLLVSLPEFGIYGLLPKAALGPEEFHFSTHSQRLRGSRSGRVYRCGNVIYVEVAKADTVKGVLLLRPVTPRVAVAT